MSAVTNQGQLLITIEIGGFVLNGLRCEVEEGMSQPDRVVVEILNLMDVDFGPLLESDAIVVLSLGGLEARRFERRLASATFLHADDGLHYALELHPRFAFLTHSMNTRKFRDMTTEAIVDKVLDEEGVTHKWRTRRPSKSRPFCVQYRETTKAFVERLLEYEGFYYYFEEDGTMVIGDTSSAELMVDGLPLFELVNSAGALTQGTTGVTSIYRGARVGSGNATVNDFNFKTPKAVLRQTSAGPSDQDLEVYDYPTGYREASVGTTLAKLRMEALTSEKRYVEGTSNVPQFAAARLFDFVHTETVDFSGSYLLVRVSHVFETAVPSGEKQAPAKYENKFFAIPSSTPWRPLLKTPRPVIEGNHTAHVRGPVGEEIHTDVYGRAKVQFHWDRESKSTDEDSRWIRVLQETSSSLVIARVGWEIVVGYIDGDPDRPIGLARNINGKMTPTYGQPFRKNMMTIKTESYPGKQGFNELRMDDSAGAMRMDWHAQRDHHNTVENDKTEKILANHMHLVKQGLNRVVALNQTHSVGGNETKDVQQSFTETVNGNRTETIGGSEHVKVKISSVATVQQNETVSIGSVRFSLVGVGAVSVPGPKYIAQVIVPHTLGAPHDDMLAGGMTAQGAGAMKMDANTETGGAAGPTGPFGGDGTFAGFGSGPPGGGGAAFSPMSFTGAGLGPSGVGHLAGPPGTAQAMGGGGVPHGQTQLSPGGSQGGGAPGQGPVSGDAPSGGSPVGGSSSGAGATSGGDTGGVSGLLGDLVGGAQGLGSIVGQVAGGGIGGQAAQGFVTGLTSGQGLQGSLSQGLQGALGGVANNIGGPLGGAMQGITNSVFSGGGVQGALSGGLAGALNSSPIGSAVSTLLGGEKGLGDIASSLAKGDFSNAMQTGALNFKGALSADGIKQLGAGVLDDIFKGTISKDTRKVLTRMIGAAEIVAAGGTVSVGSNYLNTEIVGGLKGSWALEGNVSQGASKFLVHTVGGMILRKSQEDMSMAAKKTVIRVGGMAKLHSDEKIELRGKEIEIEGQTKVSLKSGDLLVELTPESMAIKGSIKIKSGTNIKVSGKPDKLTA